MSALSLALARPAPPWWRGWTRTTWHGRRASPSRRNDSSGTPRSTSSAAASPWPLRRASPPGRACAPTWSGRTRSSTRRDGARPVRRVAPRPPLGGHEGDHAAAARRLAGLRRPRGLRPVAARLRRGAALRQARGDARRVARLAGPPDPHGPALCARPLPRAEARGARPGRPRRRPGGRRLGGGAGRPRLVARAARRGSRGARVRRGGPLQGGGASAGRFGRRGRGGGAPARAAAPRRGRAEGRPGADPRGPPVRASRTASTSSPSPSVLGGVPGASARYNRRMVRRLCLGGTLTALVLAWAAPADTCGEEAPRAAAAPTAHREAGEPSRNGGHALVARGRAGAAPPRLRPGREASRSPRRRPGGRPRPRPALLELLDDPEVEVRRMAAFALGLSGERSAVDRLLSALADPDAGVRGRAAEALGRIGDPRAAPRSRSSWSPRSRRRSAA